MENQDVVVSLDIGTTKVVVIVGKKTEHGKFEIMGMGETHSPGVKRGVVSNLLETSEAIKVAMERAEAAAGFELNHKVNVGIAGQHINSIQHRGSIMRKKTDEVISQEDVDLLIDGMHNLVMLPGEKIIHILPQEYIIDGEEGITKPVGMSGVRLEANFHIITGRELAKNNIIKCVENAGLEVADIILEPLASAEAVLSEDEKEGGVVLVDIGGGTTDIAIFYDDIIRHTAVIPFGGSVVTEDIKEGCKILRKYAEMLKVQCGSAVADLAMANECAVIEGLGGREPREISYKNLAHIIQARLEEVLEYVDHEIKNSGFRDKLIAGIVLTGGGSQLKHIAQLCEYVTGMGTRVGYPNQFLAKGNIDNITRPKYATGVGLIIKGFEAREKASRKKSGVTGHSTKKRGSFFDNFFNTTKEFFEENDIDKDDHEH